MAVEFKKWLENRHDVVKEWKEKNKKDVFGCLCCITPEEIIYAADALPVRITGSSEKLEMVDSRAPIYACPFLRSCLDLAGRGIYDYLDGVVIPNACDFTARMDYWWRKLVPRANPAQQGVELCPYVLYIKHPEKIGGEMSFNYLRGEYRIFKQHLERRRGHFKPISDDMLSNAISVYNEHYGLMEQLTQLRKRGLVSGSEAFEAEFASLLMPKNEHNELMKQYLGEVSQREPKDGVRVYLLGGGVDQISYMIYKVIEECGGNVVYEDVGVGRSYFGRNIDTSKPPLDAIIEHRLDVRCPHCITEDRFPEDRFIFARDRMEGYNIKGAIWFAPLYCECRNLEYPFTRDRLKEVLNIPALYLEHDYTLEGIGQLKPRIETFMEMVKS